MFEQSVAPVLNVNAHCETDICADVSCVQFSVKISDVSFQIMCRAQHSDVCSD